MGQLAYGISLDPLAIAAESLPENRDEQVGVRLMDTYREIAPQADVTPLARAPAVPWDPHRRVRLAVADHLDDFDAVPG